MFKPIHQHLLIKAYSNTPITDPAVCKQMLLGLVNLIEMKAVTEPQAVYIHEKGNEGLTCTINLATSHIAAHVWDKTGLLMMDVYSCTRFDTDKVMAFLTKRWDLDLSLEGERAMRVIELDRNNNLLYVDYLTNKRTNTLTLN